MLAEISNKTYLDSLFPEVANENAMEILSEAKGGVLSLHLKNFQKEGDMDENEENFEEVLIWARIVKETYGGSESAIIFVFSLIVQDSLDNYRSNVNLIFL